MKHLKKFIDHNNYYNMRYEIRRSKLWRFILNRSFGSYYTLFYIKNVGYKQKRNERT